MPRSERARLTEGSQIPNYDLFFSRSSSVLQLPLLLLPAEENSLRYLFGDCVLDTDRRELRRGAEAVSVAPQVFDLLEYLMGNRERVVSKDDLIAAIWDGRIVSDAAVTTRINVARSAIGDSGEEQRLIKTLPRKGFRFVGAVQEEEEPAAAKVDGAAEPPRAALTLPDKPSIAVLAFTNMSGDPGQDYFSDGITDDIITDLSRFSELFVIARNSSFQYKGRSPDIRQVGRELGVRYVLEGSIRCAGDRIRISAQLIDAVTGAHRWAERYDRELRDVFAVQDEVSRAIVAILVAHVNKAEAERTLLKPPATWEAHDCFMRASDILSARWSSSFNVSDLYEARRLLERSIALDPNYARAYATLSYTHVLAWIYALDEDYLSPTALERAHRLARKAVELDPNLPIAHAHFGMVLTFQGQHEESIAECEKAMALNPNFTDWRFGVALNRAGQPVRAVQVLETHMRYDPFYAPSALGVLGLARYMLKEYSQALPPLRNCVSRAPGWRDAHAWLAATLAQLGRLDEAHAEAAEVLRIDPKFTIDGTARRLTLNKRPEYTEHLFHGLRKAGLPER
jgi:adenylate cyclase